MWNELSVIVYVTGDVVPNVTVTSDEVPPAGLTARTVTLAASNVPFVPTGTEVLMVPIEPSDLGYLITQLPEFTA